MADTTYFSSNVNHTDVSPKTWAYTPGDKTSGVRKLCYFDGNTSALCNTYDETESRLEWTIAIEFRLDSVSSTQYIFSSGTSSNNQQFGLYVDSSGVLYSYIRGTSAVSTGISILANTYYHAVVSYSDSTAKTMYVRVRKHTDTTISSSSYSHAASPPTHIDVTSLSVGCLWNGGIEATGYVWNFKYWGKMTQPMTSAELDSILYGGMPMRSVLTTWWKGDEGSGTEFADSSGNGFVDFDRMTMSTQFSSELHISGDMTIAGRVQMGSGAYQYIVRAYDLATSNFPYVLYSNSGTLLFSWRDSGGTTRLAYGSLATTVGDGTWHSFVVRVSRLGNTVRFKTDDNAESSTSRGSTNAPHTADTGPVFFAVWIGSAGSYTGRGQDMYIANVEWSDQDRDAFLRGEKREYPGTCFPFRKSSGTGTSFVSQDSNGYHKVETGAVTGSLSGGGVNNATITNGTWTTVAFD